MMSVGDEPPGRCRIVPPTTALGGISNALATSVYRVVLVALGIAAALLLSEVFVRLFVPVRAVGPIFSEHHPVYGQVLKKSFSARRVTSEFSVRFSTNARGFRGPELGDAAARPILCIGDSFTMGYGVDDGDEYPALLRRLLAEEVGAASFPVVNAGVGAVGNGIWIKFLQREAPGLNPRLVVLQLCENDIRDNRREGLFSLSSPGVLIENSPPPPPRERHIQRVLEAAPGLSYSYLISLVKQVWYRHVTLARSRSDPGPPRQSVELSLQIWDEIIRICDEHSWPLLVMLVEFKNPQLGQTRSLFEVRGIPVLEAPSKTARSELYYRIDGHWNRKGHRFIAGQVVESIKIDFPELLDEAGLEGGR